jgi:hypothetical protein
MTINRLRLMLGKKWEFRFQPVYSVDSRLEAYVDESVGFRIHRI